LNASYKSLELAVVPRVLISKAATACLVEYFNLVIFNLIINYSNRYSDFNQQNKI
jgi:hypothetical protein